MASIDPSKSHQSPPNPAPYGPLILPQRLHTTLARTGNLANLLPTGTVLAFHALIPSFSNNGACCKQHKYLTACLIWFLGFFCFVSSFTDTLLGPNGKLYYGIATPKGLYVFNGVNLEEELGEGSSSKGSRDLAKYRVSAIDFVHAFVSLLVFLVFAVGHTRVLKCYLGNSWTEWSEMLVNVPLVIGAFSSFLFVLFPTNRKGIGYADVVTQV